MEDIYLITSSGRRYGITGRSVRSVRDITVLHRIPLSPRLVAGIVMEDGQAVTLADWSACLGIEQSPDVKHGVILMLETQDRPAGLVVYGEVDIVSVEAGSLLPLPESFKSPCIDTCAVIGDVLVPVIQPERLYELAMHGNSVKATEMVRGLPFREAEDASHIRFISIAGERYALPAERLENRSIVPGTIVSLPHLAGKFYGVTLFEQRLLPVIDLAGLAGLAGGVSGLTMLIAPFSDVTFGLLVERDEGVMPALKLAIRPAPPLVQTAWLEHMVICAGEIVPLIDIPGATSDAALQLAPIPDRYHPDTGFASAMFRRDVEVVEFSLLGERHALPRQEVRDVIPFRKCSEVRHAPQLVAGVAVHEGRILPVLDLARMFDRNSIATSEWRMIFVSNGDFQALVITEMIYGERRLQLDMQRRVPLNLPHPLMYGCYPDGKAVRLVLDVAAIAMHFNRSMIQHFLPALSDGMKMKSVAAELQPEAMTELVQQEMVEQKLLEPEMVESWIGEPEPSEPVIVEQEVVNEEPSVKFPAGKLYENELYAGSDTFEYVQIAPERELAIHPSGEEQVAAADSANTRQAESGQAEVQVKESLAAGMKASAELEEAVPDTPSGSSTAEVDRRSGSFIKSLRHEWSRYSYAELILLLFIATGLAALKYYAIKDEFTRAVVPITQGKIMVSPEPPANTDKPVAPLELDVAANVPVESEIYAVKEGDTLWSISERFTGDPFNYPRIAGENRLADPDLIFPGQRIKLNKSR